LPSTAKRDAGRVFGWNSRPKNPSVLAVNSARAQA